MDSGDLAAGIQAASVGDFKRASEYLSRLVKSEPANEEAWMLLGHSLRSDPDQRRACYQRVLELNPLNELAKISLARPEPVVMIDPPKPEIPGPPKPTAAINPTPPPLKKRKGNPWLRRIAAGCLSALLVLCVAGSWMVWRILNPAPQPPMYLVQNDTQPTPVADADTAQALHLMDGQEYGKAILAWDKVISLAPKNDNAYFQRARCSYALNNGQTDQQIYTNNLQAAASDLQQAISLQPDKLDYLLLRREVLTDFAYIQDLRVDRDRLFNLAASDGLKALTRDLPLAQAVYLKRQTSENLIEAGHCLDGQNLLNELVSQLSADDEFTGGVMMVQSKALACMDKLDDALLSIDASTSNGSSLDQKAYLKALYLYEAGRVAEARQVIDQTIQQTPSFSGWRYYLRAVLRAEAGDLQAAQQDLDTGVRYTWDRNGLYSYARAKLALAAGDKTGGIQWLQHAEASQMTTAEPLRIRIQDELAGLGAAPREYTPTIDLPGLSGSTPAP